jgi:GNAT superfamily N-acetyltransferase
VVTDMLTVVRVTPGVHWHALEDDLVVGRGHALHRPDGRVFVSVDTWRDDVFDVVADAMVRDLPGPVHTVVDEDDREVLVRWTSRGFSGCRREIEYVVPTDPGRTGLDQALPPRGVRIFAGDAVDPGRLRDLDAALRAEVSWSSLPAQFAPPLAARADVDTRPYLVAESDDGYVGVVRIAPLPRRPRLGLLAVRAPHRRRGVAGALLAEAFRGLHGRGCAHVSAEVDEANVAATALLARVGATAVGSALELVHRR